MAEKKIKGAVYRVHQPPAKRSLVLFARIGKVLGPGLPDLVSAIGHADDASSDKATFKALGQILERLEPEAFADFVEELVEMAEVETNGQYLPVSFDGNFSGRVQDAIEVLAFVLGEVFGDFFTGLLASGKAAKAVGSTNSKSGK